MTYKIIGGDGREYGPVSLDELRAWIGDGRVGLATRVWENEDGQWLAASARPELKWDLPMADVPPVVRAESLASPERASFPPRALAYLFDFLAVGLLVGLVSLPWNGELNNLQKAAMETSRQPVPDLGVVFQFWALWLSFHLPVSLAYHVGFNSSIGATPGKLMLGLRIVRSDGSRLTFFRALLRFVAEALSILPLGAGYLLVLINPSRQGLHDLVADTQVIRPPRPSLAA